MGSAWERADRLLRLNRELRAPSAELLASRRILVAEAIEAKKRTQQTMITVMATLAKRVRRAPICP